MAIGQQNILNDVIAWRRHIHENPELSYQEYKTADFFQHAEEAFPGGACELVEKGGVDGVDYAFALHVTPYEKAGTICIKDGVLCAAADDFKIKIIGQGGHASTQELTIDPVIIGAEITTNIQQIVSRKISALRTPVVSVTTFHAGTALNVIFLGLNTL